MPWSAKAIDLIRRQYAAVGAAAAAGLGASITALEHAQSRGLDVAELVASQRRRADHVDRYVDAYRRYVWPVESVDGPPPRPVPCSRRRKQACSSIAITTGTSSSAISSSPPTRNGSRKTGRWSSTSPTPKPGGRVAWWEELTESGGEGMVVKPSTFTARGRKGLVQPGIKCRGREYLRIIYGPNTRPAQIDRLRSRNLGRKRSLAIREFALGVEALERFVRREPLYRVHECVFGVLAMESEPVDPRL